MYFSYCFGLYRYYVKSLNILLTKFNVPYYVGSGILHNRKGSIWNGERVYPGSYTELPEPRMPLLQKPTGDDSEIYAAFIATAYLHPW